VSEFSFSHFAPRPAQSEQRPVSAGSLDWALGIQIERHRAEQIERARPAAAALAEILGRGVSPDALAARLAIEIEDAGAFRDRAERIGAFALLLAQAAEALAHEARARIARQKGGAL
jgi:hypothetical protein